MKRFLFALFSAGTIFFSASSYGATEIKFALLAPEGSTWEKIIREWNDELKQKTGGRVALKIYAGGVLGDERDVIRKMRIGQVHAGAFTSLGLGFINPEVRILDLPFLFENYAEVDAVAKNIQPKLEPQFANKGFILLAWTETGFVNIFSTRPIDAPGDMKGMKMWAWEGDPLVDALYKRFNIVPIPMALPDVLTSLQTKLLEGVYAPPLGAIALQWFTRTPYVTDLKLANSTGGILITQKAFATLSAGDQKVLQETARVFSRKLIERTRAENEQAYQTLFKAGLKLVKVPPEEAVKIREISTRVWDDLAGKLYTPQQLQEVKGALASQRQALPTAKR